mgnify:CR=1 FL=1
MVGIPVGWASIVAMFVLALPAGALSDIVDRRRFLIGVQFWMAAVACALAACTYFGLMTPGLLLGLTLAPDFATLANPRRAFYLVSVTLAAWSMTTVVAASVGGSATTTGASMKWKRMPT